MFSSPLDSEGDIARLTDLLRPVLCAPGLLRRNHLPTSPFLGVELAARMYEAASTELCGSRSEQERTVAGKGSKTWA